MKTRWTLAALGLLHSLGGCATAGLDTPEEPAGLGDRASAIAHAQSALSEQRYRDAKAAFSQILQGKSDAAIKSYLVARYGDFVLYKPPMQSNTALLWFGPLALRVVGITVWWMLSRRRAAMVPAVGMSV